MKFIGGYTFKNFEGKAEPFLHEFPVPDTVIVPFSARLSASYISLVSKGDRVYAGQKLIQCTNELPFALVSPINGTIKEITEKEFIISSEGTSSFEPIKNHTRSPWHLDRNTVIEIFCSSGCMFLFNDSFSSLKDFDRIKYIIINAVHNSPLNQSWTPEVIEDSSLLFNGLKTLGILFPLAEIILAVNKRNNTYFNTKAVGDLTSVQIMSDRYPQEYPELIVRDTIHRNLFTVEGTRDPAILVIPYFHLIHIAETLTRGRPFIDRILMIAGPGVSRPAWYRVRIGTLYEEIKRRLFKSDDFGPWHIIRGDLFNGEVITSLKAYVLPTDNEISIIREPANRELFRFINPGFTFDSYAGTTIAEYIQVLPRQLDSAVHGGVRPCVQCNYCDEVCPVRIYPHIIWKHVAAGLVEESFRFKPYMCIGCRLCDYVCPSKIDVSHSVEKAKEAFHNLRRSDK